MIKLRPFKQSEGYCGPASLKMVLSAYGIDRSERYLARVTKTSRINGCAERNIVKAAERFGFRAYMKQGSSIAEVRRLVRQGIPVIVAWFSPEEAGHYSVVVGFERDRIVLADPHFGAVKKHRIKWFEERWFDQPFDKNGPDLHEIIVIR